MASDVLARTTTARNSQSADLSEGSLGFFRAARPGLAKLNVENEGGNTGMGQTTVTSSTTDWRNNR